ncbi:MAG: hypothetical protein Q9202_007406 [Teloschistes flavicans]
MEASRLAMIEFAWRNDEEKAALCEEFLDICQQMAMSAEMPIMYRAITSYFFLAGQLKALGQQDLGRQYYNIALELVQSLPQATGGWTQSVPRLALDHRTREIKDSTGLSDLEKKEQLLGLIPEVELRNDRSRIRRLLMDSIGLARSWQSKQPNVQTLEGFRAAQARWLTFEQETAKLPCFELAALNSLFTTLSMLSPDWQSVLDEVIKFKRQHPSVFVPTLEEPLYNHAKNAAKATGQEAIYKDYHQAWKKAYLESYAARNSEEKYELSADVLEDRANYFRELQGTDPAQRRFTAMKASLRWAKSELRSGLMSMQEFLDIFGPLMPKITDESEFNTFLEHINHVDMVDALYGDLQPSPNTTWKSAFPRIEAWLQLNRPPFLEARHSVWRIMQEARNFQMSTFWANRGEVPDQESAQQIIDGDEHAEHIYKCITENSRFDNDALQCMSRKIKNVFMLSCMEKAAERGIITDELLQTAVIDTKNLILKFEDRGKPFHLYFHRSLLSRLLIQRHIHFHSIPPEAALEPMEEAHELFWRMHRDQTSHGPSRLIVAKSKLSAIYQPWVLYDQALWCCWLALLKSLAEYRQHSQDRGKTAGPPTSIDKSFKAFVTWTQRSKARILNESLGLEAQLPRSLVAQVESSPSAMASLRKEADLILKREDCLLEKKLKIQQELGLLRAEMRADTNLKPVMDFREGKTIDAEGIMQMLGTLQSNVLFLEYVYLSHTGRLHMIAIRQGAQHVPYQIPDVTLQDVDDWIEANVNKKEGEEALNWNFSATHADVNPLRVMDPIIKPLFSLQSGGQPLLREKDTLVICPTRSLHRLPFHALFIDANTPLIERHPVVYAQSFSILRYCLPDTSSAETNQQRENAAHPIPSPRAVLHKKTILHPLPNDDPSTPSIQTLGTSLSASTLSGLTITAPQALAHFSNATLIHYYGHISFHARSPQSSGLCLNEASRKATPRHAVKGAETLTAEMIYDQLRLNTATNADGAARALVTLIGCNSGAAQVSKGDDLNGLVTAFLLAGAGSVVSTLWPIDREDGLAFGERFYGELERQERELLRRAEEAEGQRETGEVEIELDLARAMQVGIEALRWEKIVDDEENEGMREQRVERTPYHWAGFVLNGYWKLRGPLFTRNGGTTCKGEGGRVMPLRGKLVGE